MASEIVLVMVHIDGRALSRVQHLEKMYRLTMNRRGSIAEHAGVMFDGDDPLVNQSSQFQY